MIRRALPLAFHLVVLASLTVPSAFGQEPADPNRRYTEPLGIALETWDYPHEVRFLPLDIEGERHLMAYMDVAPTGAPLDRTVTLFHGKNFFGAYWEQTIAALAAAGYRVVVPDQIGFGKSAKPGIDYSFDLLIANTTKLLDELGVRETAVVGHSMGGMVAVRFARAHPERTTHLVLENPIGLEDYRFQVPPRPLAELIEGELSQSEADVRSYIKSYPVTWDPEVFEPFVEVHSRVQLSGEYPRWARSAALTYLMVYQQPVRHELGLIEVPTLLVIGQEDRTALGKGAVSKEVAATLGRYPRLGREAAADIPGAKLVELEDVGHIPHLEVPERFHEELLGFLSAGTR
jgi:pimeloyl-ACP methyl ester carboxylesterase